MAAQTITTAVNYDDSSISGLLNGETITVNGGFLTIDSDVRWAQQAAVMGSIICSSVLGGSVLIDGTNVWELPFTASTGNVPELAALGANGVTGGTSGATGELLRVWATGSLTPITTGGGAMPATGWIKLRTRTGNFQAGEIVTLPGGATITIATAGRRSWLHIVGREAVNIQAARVSGTCSMTGDWYELGVTDGSDDQTFQFPVDDYCPAIQVETAVGSGVYEWWLYADNRWGTATQYVATDVRGKYFGMDPATGVITIARRATNPCGFKPVSGLRIRIPNLICSSSSSADWNANTFSTTLSNRYRGFNVAAASASASYDKICSNWDIGTNAGTDCTITNTASMPLRVLQQMSGLVTITNVGIGCCPVTITTSAALNVSSLANIVVSDIRVTKRENNGSNEQAINFGSVVTGTYTNIQAEIFGATESAVRSATSGSTVQWSRCGNSTINNLIAIGAVINFNTFVGAVTVNGVTYGDCLVGSTQTTVSAISPNAINTCTNFTFNGPMAWFGGLTNVQSYNQLFSVSSTSRNVIIQNIGTSAAPFDLGGVSGYLTFANDADNIILRRCYVSNTRTNILFFFSSATTNSTVDNCGSDYADATQLTGVDTKIRGIKTNLGVATSAGRGTNIADMFTSATAGRIIFAGADPAAINPQLVITGGTGAATSGGGAVILPNVNDTATWETPWFILGHTALANSDLTLTGTNTGNFAYDFQYDLGTGWNGTWLTADVATLSGIGAINPAVGIKLKMRATATVANATNAINFISVITVTDAVSQDTLYPFPFDATGTVSGIVAGSRIQIYNQTTNTEIANQVVSGTTFTYEYYNGTGISAGNVLRIRVALIGYLPQELLAVATASGFSVLSSQQPDTVYNDNGIDGSTVTEFAADYPNVQVDISDPDGLTSVKRIYAWFRYTEASQDGIAQWFNGMSADDEANYQIDQSILNLRLDNVSATPVRVIDGRLYRLDGSTVIASTSNSIQMDPNRVYPTNTLINSVNEAVTAAKLAASLSA